MYSSGLRLFVPTSAQLLVPNPHSSEHLGPDHLKYFNLMGKTLGKAVYERILVEPQFSPVFLNVLLGHFNQLDDLMHLDETFFRSLMAIKRMAADALAGPAPASTSSSSSSRIASTPVISVAGDDIQPTLSAGSSSSSSSEQVGVESLGLFFEVERQSPHSLTRAATAAPTSVPLIPGGSEIPVTNQNASSYVHRLANFKLNTEIAEQCCAFLHGFRELIPLNWIRMFNPRELQLVIGGEQRPLDLRDMKRNVVRSK